MSPTPGITGARETIIPTILNSTVNSSLLTRTTFIKSNRDKLSVLLAIQYLRNESFQSFNVLFFYLMYPFRFYGNYMKVLLYVGEPGRRARKEDAGERARRRRRRSILLSEKASVAFPPGAGGQGDACGRPTDGRRTLHSSSTPLT